jgi:hypothetical protein
VATLRGSHFFDFHPILCDTFTIIFRRLVMAHAATKDFVKIPKQEYNVLKEVYKTVQRQAFLMRIDDAEKNFAIGKTKTVSVDDLITSI